MKWFWTFVGVFAAIMWGYYAVTVEQPLVIHFGLATACLSALRTVVAEHVKD